MDIPDPPRDPSIAELKQPLQRYVGQPFPVIDQVVLCCFGPELNGERTYEQLRQALHDAGFNGPLARHTINTSRLLRRSPSGCYRIQNFRA
jgi:hypothetical protein